MNNLKKKERTSNIKQKMDEIKEILNGKSRITNKLNIVYYIPVINRDGKNGKTVGMLEPIEVSGMEENENEIILKNNSGVIREIQKWQLLNNVVINSNVIEKNGKNTDVRLYIINETIYCNDINKYVRNGIEYDILKYTLVPQTTIDGTHKLQLEIAKRVVVEIPNSIKNLFYNKNDKNGKKYTDTDPLLTPEVLLSYQFNSETDQGYINKKKILNSYIKNHYNIRYSDNEIVLVDNISNIRIIKSIMYDRNSEITGGKKKKVTNKKKVTSKKKVASKKKVSVKKGKKRV